MAPEKDEKQQVFRMSFVDLLVATTEGVSGPPSRATKETDLAGLAESATAFDQT